MERFFCRVGWARALSNPSRFGVPLANEQGSGRGRDQSAGRAPLEYVDSSILAQSGANCIVDLLDQARQRTRAPFSKVSYHSYKPARSSAPSRRASSSKRALASSTWGQSEV